MNRIDNAISFKQAFCAYFKCPSEQYLKRALQYSFYRHSLITREILCWFHPVSIKLAVQSIEMLETAKDREDVAQIMEDYRYQLRINRVNFMVSFLRIRLSGRRVLDLYEKLCPLMKSQVVEEAPRAHSSELVLAEVPLN